MEKDKKNACGDSAILGWGDGKFSVVVVGGGLMENFRNDNILDWTSRQLLRPIVKTIK